MVKNLFPLNRPLIFQLFEIATLHSQIVAAGLVHNDFVYIHLFLRIQRVIKIIEGRIVKLACTSKVSNL